MIKEKRFFRVRLSDKCPSKKKMINGVPVTKKWQIKTGEIGDFVKFADVEAEVVVKQGNGFAFVEKADGGAAKGPDGDSTGCSSGSVPTPAKDAEGAQKTAKAATDSAPGFDDAFVSGPPPNFNEMTVENLKNVLITAGVSQTELRNATKPDLIERAEFLWSQKK